MAYQPPANPQPVMQGRPMIARPRTRPAGGSGCLWLIFIVMAALFGGIGGWWGWGSWTLVQGGASADGTVVGLRESNDDGSTTYAPIIDYFVDGETYEMASSSYSSPPAYHVGQPVQVLYDRSNPNNARINNFWELWLLPIIFVGLAVLFTAISAVSILISLVRRISNRAA